MVWPPIIFLYTDRWFSTSIPGSVAATIHQRSPILGRNADPQSIRELRPRIVQETLQSNMWSSAPRVRTGPEGSPPGFGSTGAGAGAGSCRCGWLKSPRVAHVA